MTVSAEERERWLRMYRSMIRIKQTDDTFLKLLSTGQVFHPYYSPRGQEAIPAAVCEAIEPSDLYVTTYRGLHDTIAKGVPLTQIFAEYFGRATGTCGGKGGPMHITHPASGLMITTGIVGAGLPIANGFALADKMRGSDRVTVCNFGDGATNIGAFHEALNLASVWKLPVIFVCQNNLWGEHTPIHATTAAESIADRAAAYGIGSVTVDGNDPVAVFEAARPLVAAAREGRGPSLIEAMTFRFRGHTNGDDSSYIPAAEFEAALARDPIPAFRDRLIAEGELAVPALEEVEADVAAEVQKAAQYGLDSPYPEPGDNLLTDVFKEAS